MGRWFFAKQISLEGLVREILSTTAIASGHYLNTFIFNSKDQIF